MSSVDDTSQENYIATASGKVQYSTRNYGSVGVSIAGTISAGNFKAYGSDDGDTWQELSIGKGGNQLASAGITETGTYVILTTSYALTELRASDDFSGSVRIMATISTRVPPVFIVGFE